MSDLSGEYLFYHDPNPYSQMSLINKLFKRLEANQLWFIQSGFDLQKEDILTMLFSRQLISLALTQNSQIPFTTYRTEVIMHK